jgi:Asp-tRNA(Asn)/Glu-tRNA(Gln) amidotransferase B subunit
MSNAAVTQVSVFVHASGNAEVYFHNIGVRPVMAWPLAASRYPTHIDMALKAVEVATRKLGEGAFNPDISISTPETRAAKAAAVMAG